MKSIKFNEFMSGEYKVKEKKKRQKRINTATRLATSAALPLATGGMVGTLGMVAVAKSAFASTQPIEAVPATAKEWMGEQTLSALAHVLDPVVDILVALSLPVASVVIVGACFFFMFGNAEKAWGMIQNAGLGYVLIQVSPLILNVLQQVGNAV
jgi:hypothetical protein